jgi:hypothetical protein
MRRDLTGRKCLERNDDEGSFLYRQLEHPKHLSLTTDGAGPCVGSGHVSSQSESKLQLLMRP